MKSNLFKIQPNELHSKSPNIVNCNDSLNILSLQKYNWHASHGHVGTALMPYYHVLSLFEIFSVFSYFEMKNDIYSHSVKIYNSLALFISLMAYRIKLTEQLGMFFYKINKKMWCLNKFWNFFVSLYDWISPFTSFSHESGEIQCKSIQNGHYIMIGIE